MVEQKWIPFKLRPLTEDEKEYYPYESMLDCKLPEDGQRILVSISRKGHEAVQMDEYYDDDGSYLDSGYEIGTEATAWMPLPTPWEEDEQSEQEDYTKLKREFILMASYIDTLLVCSDEQKETLLGFISRMSEFMPWIERD